MKYSATLFLLLVSFAISHAQPFTNVASGLPAVGRSAVAFADFDNDNDLDIVMIGLDANYNAMGKIFLNQQGSFQEVVSGIAGLYNSALAVADYDLDGDMDIAMTGQDMTGFHTWLYQNNGSAEFTLTSVSLAAAGADGDLAWGDYNLDGLPDLVVSGGWNTSLYRNLGGGSFEEVEAGLTIMNSPSVDWGDCDNDGDPDLLMVGDAGSVAETFIYLNNNGEFTRLETNIEGAVGGMASWGDYDNDGNLDLLITGKDLSLVPVSYVYRNNGDKTFSFANAGLVGTALGPADWIDYDNDGDLDIMLAGENAGCGNASTRLYYNNGIGEFYEYLAGLPFVERASSAWGDYDNDGDYDLLLTGLSGDPVTRLYRNDLLSNDFQPNTPPGIPGDFYTYVSGDYAVISWSRVTDAQSPQEAITYNVMAGTQSGNINVVSPMSDPVSGNRYCAGPGNAGNNDFMVFRGLLPGTFYFRVQAIDQAFAGSPFSEEGSFSIVETGINPTGTPQPTLVAIANQLIITCNPLQSQQLQLFDAMGHLLFTQTLQQADCRISIDRLPAGLYLARLSGGMDLKVCKFVKR